MGREAPHLCLLQAPWGVPRALPWLPSCWLSSSGSPWCEPLSTLLPRASTPGPGGRRLDRLALQLQSCPRQQPVCATLITITRAWHSPLGGRQG